MEADDDDDSHSDAEDEDDVEMEDAEAADRPQFKPMPKRQSVADLRAKLHARIDELRQNRKSEPTLERSPKDDLIDEQRKQREKRDTKEAQQKLQTARNQVRRA